MGKKIKVIVLFILEMLFIVTIVLSTIKILLWIKYNRDNKAMLDEISTLIIDSDDVDNLNYSVNFDELKNRNSDTVAWIKVNGTQINYPVVKYVDNSFYLKHNFDKAYNDAGWIFADFRNRFDRK